MIKEGDIVTTKSGFWIGIASSCNHNLAFEYEVRWFADLRSGASSNFHVGGDERGLRLYEPREMTE